MAKGQDLRGDLSDKDRGLVELVLDYKDRFTARRWIYEREWFRNILFYVGQQWIVYEEGNRRWRLRNMPNWVPTPITNRIASTVNVIRSSVAQVHPAFQARPLQENERSVLTANAADKYLDVIMQESGFRAARRRMASWVTLTGNAFLHTEFDTSADTGTVDVPGEVCLDCGQQMKPQEIPENLLCPNCGSGNLQESKELGETIPQGMIRVRALSPFEVYVDPFILEMEDQPGILLIEQKNTDTIKQLYPDTGTEVTADNEALTGRNYLNSLAQTTGSGFNSGAPTGVSPAVEGDGAATIYRLFVKTCRDYPDGVYVVMSGDQHVLEAKEPYPFRFKATRRPFYPVVHVLYDDVPGRFWGKTPVDDLVPKQRQRNEMESLFQTITMRCANPIWLVPTSVQTTPITGDPAIVVRYSSASGAKPERIAGLEVPQSVLAFIQQIDQDFEEIANTFAVMKGKNPGSVRAASAIQMLIERGFGRYGSVFDNLEEAYERWAVQALELWRQKAVFPRVQAVARVSGAWQFMEFLGSDLGDVDITVEAGSTRPKSQAGRQMLVQQLLQMALLNPNDPEQRKAIFEEFGATSLLAGAEADIKIVAEENMMFMTWAQEAKAKVDEATIAGAPGEAVSMLLQQTFPIRGNAVLDHHPTHLIHHRRFALTEAFRALPQALQQMFVMHMVAAHYVPLVQEQMSGMGPMGLAIQANATMMGGPPGGPQAGKNAGGGPRVGGAQTPFGQASPNTPGPTSSQGTG